MQRVSHSLVLCLLASPLAPLERCRVGFKRQHQRLNARAGNRPCRERRQLPAPQFLGRQRRRLVPGKRMFRSGASNGMFSTGSSLTSASELSSSPRSMAGGVLRRSIRFGPIGPSFARAVSALGLLVLGHGRPTTKRED
jgi:hypothetical protein